MILTPNILYYIVLPNNICRHDFDNEHSLSHGLTKQYVFIF